MFFLRSGGVRGHSASVSASSATANGRAKGAGVIIAPRRAAGLIAGRRAARFIADRVTAVVGSSEGSGVRSATRRAAGFIAGRVGDVSANRVAAGRIAAGRIAADDLVGRRTGGVDHSRIRDSGASIAALRLRSS